VIPWTIFSIMGIQLATFFFMFVVEIIHCIILFKNISNSMRIFISFSRSLAYLISFVVGISYLKKLIENSIQYTKETQQQLQKKEQFYY